MWVLMLAVSSSGICLVRGGAIDRYSELVVVSGADSPRVDLNCKQIMDVYAKDRIRPMGLATTNARVAVIAWFCCQADYTSAMLRKSIFSYHDTGSSSCVDDTSLFSRGSDWMGTYGIRKL